MNRIEKALEIYKQRFNCSQAVFTAFRQAEQMTEGMALKLSTVFGAGVGCTGEGLCGAVSGALMAISMKHGRGDVQSVDAKVRTYEMARQFMSDFEARQGSCLCKGLLGIGIGTPEGMARAVELKLFETKCVEVVRTAAEILDRTL